MESWGNGCTCGHVQDKNRHAASRKVMACQQIENTIKVWGIQSGQRSSEVSVMVGELNRPNNFTS